MISFGSAAHTSELGSDSDAPIMIQPQKNTLLASFVQLNLSVIDEAIARHGAVLLRGFSMEGVDDFGVTALLLSDVLLNDYGDLPPSGSRGTYFATPYDSSLQIEFHNEASHTATIPGRQFFYCEHPADKGGAWRIVDGQRVVQQLPAAVVKEFCQRNLLYRRRFIPGLDVSWQQFFRVENVDAAKLRAQELGYDADWDDKEKIFTTFRRAPAIIKNGTVWFNQILLHHPRALPEHIYEGLEGLFGRDGFPRQVFFGDGEVIEDDIVDLIRETLEAKSLTIDTRQGDVLILNNLRFAHSRAPYEGHRSVRVALGNPVLAEKLTNLSC